jgi:uncharacterized protein YkwD
MLAAGATAAVMGAAAAPATTATSCSNADLQPATDNLRRVRHATLCLLNVQRTRRHLGKLHANGALRGVAESYAQLMVTLHFFDHVSPTGSTFVDRIKQSTYLDGATGWELGENLAWGGGTLATPRSIVRAWMHSPGHRHNILTRAFRDIGVGVAIGVPVLAGGSGATYVNEFGQRTR